MGTWRCQTGPDLGWRSTRRPSRLTLSMTTNPRRSSATAARSGSCAWSGPVSRENSALWEFTDESIYQPEFYKGNLPGFESGVHLEVIEDDHSSAFARRHEELARRGGGRRPGAQGDIGFIGAVRLNRRRRVRRQSPLERGRLNVSGITRCTASMTRSSTSPAKRLGNPKYTVASPASYPPSFQIRRGGVCSRESRWA